MGKNIDNLVEKFFAINDNIKDLKAKLECVKAEIKLEMKSDKLERYDDPNGNRVSYKIQHRKSLDKNKVKDMIENDGDYEKCFKTSEFEMLKVVSKESLETMKKFMPKK